MILYPYIPYGISSIAISFALSDLVELGDVLLDGQGRGIAFTTSCIHLLPQPGRHQLHLLQLLLDTLLHRLPDRCQE